MNTIAENLKKARLDKGYSLAELSELTGVTVKALAAYEDGERVPRDEVKTELAAKLGKSLQELFGPEWMDYWTEDEIGRAAEDVGMNAEIMELLLDSFESEIAQYAEAQKTPLLNTITGKYIRAFYYQVQLLYKARSDLWAIVESAQAKGMAVNTNDN